MIYKSGGRNRIPYGVLNLATPGTFRVVSTINASEIPPKARITFGSPS